MDSIISFFTGAGFLDLGFEHEGFRVDLVNEYSREFMAGYRHARRRLGSPEPAYGHHLGSVEHFADGEGRTLLDRAVADVRSRGGRVGFIGGPPCPDFSVAGKNAGGEGDNGRLTATYLQVVRQAKPDFFVFENVEGLWRTAVHRAFYEAQKEMLREAGYALHDRLVNSLEYGVGQDRSRILLVGFLDAGAESFPWEAGMTGHSRIEILSRDWPGAEEADFEEDAGLPFPEGLPRELTVGHWFEKNRVESHPNGGMAFNPKSDRFREIHEGDVKKKCFKRLHRWRYSPTAAYGNNEVHLHPWKARRISVAEALAIQSLPPEFELPADMTLSACFKTIGNGVPYLLARGLAKSVNAHLAAADARPAARRARRVSKPEAAEAGPWLEAAE